MAIGQFQQDIHLGVNQDPKYSKEPPLYTPGSQVLIKVWKDGSPKAQLQPTWKGPYPVILSTPGSSQDMIPGFTTHESNHGRKQKRTLSTPVSSWEISETYSELQMSSSRSNEYPQIKFLGIIFLRTTLKSQHSLAGIVFQNRPEIDLLIPVQEGT